MSYSTHNVHEVVGISVSEPFELAIPLTSISQTVKFFFKDGSTHEITAFYEPGAETMKPRKYPEPAVEGDYKQENFPRDYVL